MSVSLPVSPKASPLVRGSGPPATATTSAGYRNGALSDAEELCIRMGRRSSL
jgi:hypothetical protein